MNRKQNLPRGIRNNNPGNIEWGDPWQGLVHQSQASDPRFCQFVKPADGIRAIARTLITYQDKRRAGDGSNIDSILEVIQRWAPGKDNNPTTQYAQFIARLIDGVDFDDEVLDMHNYDHIKPLVEGIIRFENGLGPRKNDNTWYPSDVIDEALHRAGVVRRKRKVVTVESTASVGMAGVGSGQLADSLPSVMDAVQQANGHVSSGNIVQVVMGVTIIGLACAIAYSQYRKASVGAT